MNMADRIQYLRKAKGLSQEQLADKVGVSRQAVSKWESEQSTPDVERIIATIAGIWAFTANRFRTDESLFIILAGAAVGFGIGLVTQVVTKLLKK